MVLNGTEWEETIEGAQGIEMTSHVIPTHRRRKQKTHKSVSPYKHASVPAIVNGVGEVIASYR